MARRGFKIELLGEERVAARLVGLASGIQREATASTGIAVEAVKAHIVAGINSPPKTGRTYRKYGPRRDHRASRRGEWPAGDTGNLVRSLYADVEAGMLILPNLDAADLSMSVGLGEDLMVVGIVGAAADYAVPLEYKPISRGGRPFMRRGLAEARPEVRAAFMLMRGKFGQ